MKNPIAFIAVWLTVLALVLPNSTLLQAEVVKLKDGPWIKGKILKQTKKVVIIDLGYDLLRIPGSEVADIAEDIPVEKSTPQDSHPLYTARHMDRTSTTDGARDYQEAVVLVRTPGGMGSGFLVNEKGYVITNFHVVHGEKHVNITRYKQTDQELKRIVYKDVRIVALDPFHDLAVLQVDEKETALGGPAVLSPEETVNTGEKVFVIGNPMGLERTVTEGVVSHTGRMFAGKVYLQVDAAINPGNSGGPLFNSRGQVIGVVNMGARFMQGLNFAIPVHHVKFLLRHIDAFAYNEANPSSGYVYPLPPRNPSKGKTSPKKAPPPKTPKKAPGVKKQDVKQ